MPDQESQKPHLSLKLKKPDSPAQPSAEPAAPQARQEQPAAPVTTSTQSLRATTTMKLKILSAEASAPVQSPQPVSVQPIPPSQQTIKLRPPSVGTSSGASPIPAARQTIRLIPKPAPGGPPSAGIQSASPSQATVRFTAAPSTGVSPSQQTVQLGGTPQPAASPSQPTIKLGAGSAASAPQQTVKLVNPIQSPAAKQTIRLTVKPSVAPTPSETAARTVHIPPPTAPTSSAASDSAATMSADQSQAGAEKGDGKKRLTFHKDRPADSHGKNEPLAQLKAKAAAAKVEPNMWLLSSSIAATVIVFIVAFYFMAQYLNIYQGASIKVPFMEQALIK